ncbi:MmoB/DmpM family protein [Sphingobacterium sp. HJSM2_6]|uniref:MmoB/DmpM family protein n=1 Tax=Sphingobacterium sp. HJSM2_6 TaxID=3366264 RepID=UPI003BCF540A
MAEVSKVFLALQAVEESKAVVAAIEKDNPDAVIEYDAAMVKITAPGRLTINVQTVSDLIGREWDSQELQIILITLSGNVDEDYDYFTLFWD